jgi:DNA polymerase V
MNAKNRKSEPLMIPLSAERVAAGFPSPAEGYIEQALDLNEHLIHHPAATFFVRADGESMVGAGIFPEDLLVVDRSLNPVNGSVVIAVIDGDFTVKRLSLSKEEIRLFPENSKFESITITEENEFQVWGVVTFSIHSHRISKKR